MDPGETRWCFFFVRDEGEHRFVSLRDSVVEMGRPRSIGTDFPFDGPDGIIDLPRGSFGSFVRTDVSVLIFA